MFRLARIERSLTSFGENQALSPNGPLGKGRLVAISKHVHVHLHPIDIQSFTL